jgi:uncharacterized protein
LNVRVPSWISNFPEVSVNGERTELSVGPGSYLVISRLWQNGDQVDVTFPMSVYVRSMPDDPSQQAFFYGPLLLGGLLGDRVVPGDLVTGPMGPKFNTYHPPAVPDLHRTNADLQQWIRKGPESLTFRVGDSMTFVPFNTIAAGRPYSIYWTIS